MDAKSFGGKRNFYRAGDDYPHLQKIIKCPSYILAIRFTPKDREIKYHADVLPSVDGELEYFIIFSFYTRARR